MIHQSFLKTYNTKMFTVILRNDILKHCKVLNKSNKLKYRKFQRNWKLFPKVKPILSNQICIWTEFCFMQRASRNSSIREQSFFWYMFKFKVSFPLLNQICLLFDTLKVKVLSIIVSVLCFYSIWSVLLLRLSIKFCWISLQCSNF